MLVCKSQAIDMSDDDFENDQPCTINELIWPNLNTDHNSDNQPRTKCSVPYCDYESKKGWKQLTKHHVRQHPGMDAPNSRLSKNFNPLELMVNSFPSTFTNGPNGILVQSLCYICNERYNMCSEKWLWHFIAHTGNHSLKYSN